MLGTNGWTTFNFTGRNQIRENLDYLEQKEIMNERSARAIIAMAKLDKQYLSNTIRTCQTMKECQHIVVITSSIPNFQFIAHDYDYNDSIVGDCAGNNDLTDCFLPM